MFSVYSVGLFANSRSPSTITGKLMIDSKTLCTEDEDRSDFKRGFGSGNYRMYIDQDALTDTPENNIKKVNKFDDLLSVNEKMLKIQSLSQPFTHVLLDAAMKEDRGHLSFKEIVAIKLGKGGDSVTTVLIALKQGMLRRNSKKKFIVIYNQETQIVTKYIKCLETALTCRAANKVAART